MKNVKLESSDYHTDDKQDAQGIARSCIAEQ